MNTSDSAVAARRIQLTNAPAFSLGEVRIEPRLRRLLHADGREQLIEPRVMQVLVALAQADGDVVSRDELLESWSSARTPSSAWSAGSGGWRSDSPPSGSRR